MRHIGDVNPQPPLIALLLNADRVIKVLRIIRIDGDDIVRAAIDTAFALLSAWLVVRPRFGNRLRLMQHVLRKMQRQVVMPQHGEHIDAFLIRRAEHFDDLALGCGLLGLPLRDFHDHLVAHVRLAAHIAGFRHINRPRKARIIRRDVQELLRALQGADKLRALAFQHAHHAAALVLLPRLHIQTHQHAVAMHRGAGVSVRDADLGDARLVRLHKTTTTTRDLNHPRHQVRLLRNDVAIALCADDFPLFLQAFEQALQHLLLIGLHAQL